MFFSFNNINRIITTFNHCIIFLVLSVYIIKYAHVRACMRMCVYVCVILCADTSPIVLGVISPHTPRFHLVQLCCIIHAIIFLLTEQKFTTSFSVFLRIAVFTRNTNKQISPEEKRKQFTKNFIITNISV